MTKHYEPAGIVINTFQDGKGKWWYTTSNARGRTIDEAEAGWGTEAEALEIAHCGLENDPVPEDSMTDVEADADTLRSAGYGTDEDYGMYDERG